MGKTARQFMSMYIKYKQKFKKPLAEIATLMPRDFSDEFYVETFQRLYPHLWDDLQKQYSYWHNQNDYIIKKGKKSRYNFRKPFNFILDCSYGIRKKAREKTDRIILSEEERNLKEQEILESSNAKLMKQKKKVSDQLYYVQEIEPVYARKYIDYYFHTFDLHERLEIMRELSKFKSERITQFFYKVNACTRNFSLHEQAMKYIQGIGLPFKLKGKKKGKKNFIDNEVVKNNSSPSVLLQRLYMDNLEKHKKFDMFISHNSKSEKEIVEFYKAMNKKGYVAYVDWVNDKFDLKRQWCNKATAEVIKERIKQSRFFVIYLTTATLQSQWCPWEIGLADAYGKKICVFQQEEIEKIPEFYKVYPKIILDTSVFIKDDGIQIPIEEWLNQ